MATLIRVLVFSFMFYATNIIAAPQDSPSSTTSSAIPASSTACGDVIRAVTKDPYGIANAVEAWNCLVTVPFNPAVANNLIRYYNDTLQFHSTLDYLRTPPSSYQQSAVDLLAGLQSIQDDVNQNKFGNEYQFEATLQNLIYSANDPHLSFFGGVLSAFTFGSTWGLSSVSTDGKALPRTYLTDDILLNSSKGIDETWSPSPIVSINGSDVNEYLSKFAALNSLGSLEPNADWNLLFQSPVLDVLYENTIWSGLATFYPGDDLIFIFENGSKLETKWKAVYYDAGPTGPLETGGDFYNYFVLGLVPASFVDQYEDVENATAQNNQTSPAVQNFFDYSNGAYPENVDVAQADLGNTGYVTGYIFSEQSLGVLSIPTFYADGPAIEAFSLAVAKFINHAQSQGISKILIDLQQNSGGDTLMAYNTFKQFFPNIDPFGGSNMRAQRYVNATGLAITSYWENLTPDQQNDIDNVDIAGNEWVATTKLNAETGQNFTSWEEFYGPYPTNISDLTATRRYNISDYTLDYVLLDDNSPPMPLWSHSTASPPFAAENIVILSDGLCSSACTLFMEMMHHEAGVRTVVAGGRPETGPMQAASGSRGARMYDLVELDDNLEYAFESYDNNTNILPAYRDTMPFFFFDGSVNLLSQVRQNDPTPLQMLYEAANCRIYYTPETVYNFTNLWTYAARAIWSDQSLCVEGSTGYATTGGSAGATVLPAPARSFPQGVAYDQYGALEFNPPDIDAGILRGTGPAPDDSAPASSKQGKAGTSHESSHLSTHGEHQPPRHSPGDQSQNMKPHSGIPGPPAKRRRVRRSERRGEKSSRVTRMRRRV